MGSRVWKAAEKRGRAERGERSGRSPIRPAVPACWCCAGTSSARRCSSRVRRSGWYRSPSLDRDRAHGYRGVAMPVLRGYMRRTTVFEKSVVVGNPVRDGWPASESLCDHRFAPALVKPRRLRPSEDTMHALVRSMAVTVVLFLSAPPAAARAATILVDSTLDDLDQGPNGNCTLREAVLSANDDEIGRASCRERV